MSDAEKKDKLKKKKSVKKESDGDKPGEGLVPPPGDAERKPSLTPSDTKQNGEPKSRKASSAIEIPGGEKKEGKSRKTSAVDAPQKAKAEKDKSEAKDGGEKKEENGEDESDGEMPIMPSPPRQWNPDKTPFQAIIDAEKMELPPPEEFYCAPPESTKLDVELLQDLDTRRIAELMEAFAMFDFDQDGVITHNDLKMTFASIDRPDVGDEEVEKMLSEGMKPLDFDNFVVLMGYKTLEMDAEETLSEALSQWDYGTEGLISEERLRHDIMTWGDKFTEEEAAAALEDAPTVVLKNKEKMINYMKFSNDLCGLRKRMKQKAKQQK